MVAAISSIHESNDRGQTLLNEVVRLFADLLIASGATIPMISAAMTLSVEGAVENKASTIFTDLGSLLRDCMEIMCTWRRDVIWLIEMASRNPSRCHPTNRPLQPCARRRVADMLPPTF
jgi:hypothetical protein